MTTVHSASRHRQDPAESHVVCVGNAISFYPDERSLGRPMCSPAERKKGSKNQEPTHASRGCDLRVRAEAYELS